MDETGCKQIQQVSHRFAAMASQRVSGSSFHGKWPLPAQLLLG
jgi:hypothetical protein